jgi:hypothetical protein
MQSQPFKRVLAHFKLVQALLASNPNLGLESLPKFQQAKGKGKGKNPIVTGHKHMSYKRRMLKLRTK